MSNPENPTEKPNRFSPSAADLEMYQVPGQDQITNHALSRYTNDRKQNENIVNRIGLSPLEKTRETPKKQETRPSIKKEWIEKMDHTPDDNERASLIRKGLSDPDIKTQQGAAFVINYVDDEKEKDSLKELSLLRTEEGLASQNVEVRRVAAEMIGYVHDTEKALSFIEKGINDSDLSVQKITAKMISNAPTDKIAQLIMNCLKSNNVEAQLIAAKKIWAADDREIGRLVQEGLASQNVEVRRVAVEMIEKAPKKEIPQLVQTALEKGLENELVVPPLYKHKYADIGNASFSRRRFDKTDSETTLVGGELMGKAIIRHIKPEAFLLWQKVYENYELWRKNGFDYVPIEPILSYRLNEQGLVDVYSSVLDLDYTKWQNISNKFLVELEEQRTKILKVLKDEKISHSHPIDSNFCLRFFRNPQGKVDFDKTPRLYLIDWD